jgi:hypothetical protein
MKKNIIAIIIAISLLSCSTEDNSIPPYKSPEECGCVKQNKTIKTYIDEVGQPKETTYTDTWLVCEKDTNGEWFFDRSNGLWGENKIHTAVYFKVDCPK